MGKPVGSLLFDGSATYYLGLVGIGAYVYDERARACFKFFAIRFMGLFSMPKPTKALGPLFFYLGIDQQSSPALRLGFCGIARYNNPHLRTFPLSSMDEGNRDGRRYPSRQRAVSFNMEPSSDGASEFASRSHGH